VGRRLQKRAKMGKNGQNGQKRAKTGKNGQKRKDIRIPSPEQAITIHHDVHESNSSD
jgi:hypothetical protein